MNFFKCAVTKETSGHHYALCVCVSLDRLLLVRYELRKQSALRWLSCACVSPLACYAGHTERAVWSGPMHFLWARAPSITNALIFLNLYWIHLLMGVCWSSGLDLPPICAEPIFLFDPLSLSLCDSKIWIATCSNFPLSKGKPASPTAAKTSWIN
jgi:hypothetical protein